MGVIAEDETDSKAAAVLIRRILPGQVVVHQRDTRGGGNMQRKGAAYMKDLALQGCAAVILLHDLDRDVWSGELKDATLLRRRLEAIPKPPALIRFVCIPVEELEAWFWSDRDLLRRVAAPQNIHAARDVDHPESLPQPKEKLKRLSRAAGGRAHYDSSRNEELALQLSLDECKRRCPSFAGLHGFLIELGARSRFQWG